jgi:cyclomaltodextrinase
MFIQDSLDDTHFDGAELMMKEVIFKTVDDSIKMVHAGFFPSVGRYFRKQMTKRGDYFVAKVQLPKGTSFYHFFVNGKFHEPLVNKQVGVLAADLFNRMPIVLETPVFCPVEFEQKPNYICHIQDDIWEIRAITHHSWIKNVDLFTQHEAISFSIAYRNKNNTFWVARIQKRESFEFCIRISGGGLVRFLLNDLKCSEIPQFDKYFLFPGNNVKSSPDNYSLRAGYQIMPDRFCYVPNEIPLPSFVQKWGEESGMFTYFGGNLKGMLRQLSYLADLGVDFLYINPVFFAKSYHRYDCLDYKAIDPLLGDEKDLHDYIREAHRLKIKIILDISLNHCGIDFFAFKDVLQNQEKSEYRDWFNIQSFPVIRGGNCNYGCWHGYYELPQFNLYNKQVEDYFMQVARYWPEKFGIDGWRIDVSTEIPGSFLEKFITETRKVKTEMIVVGESLQKDATRLTADCKMNGITNYSLYFDVLIPFFQVENISVSTLASFIMKTLSSNSFTVNRSSWSFMSNHDIPRFYSILKNKQKYHLALALIYFLPGTPVIYYGEECNIEGMTDPSNRKCMDFDPCKRNAQFTKCLKELNEYKTKYEPIFSFGKMAIPFVSDSDKILVIERFWKNERLLLISNFGQDKYVWDATEKFADSKSSDAGPFEILVDAYSFQILHLH